MRVLCDADRFGAGAGLYDASEMHASVVLDVGALQACVVLVQCKLVWCWWSLILCGTGATV